MSVFSGPDQSCVKGEQTLEPLYSETLDRCSTEKEGTSTNLVFDQLLTTIHNVVVALRIPGTNITCLEPPVRSDGILGSARVVEIALQCTRPKLFVGQVIRGITSGKPS